MIKHEWTRDGTSFAAYPEQIGVHVHVRVFAGPDAEHRALTGVLVMRPDEAAAFVSQECEHPGVEPCTVLGCGGWA